MTFDEKTYEITTSQYDFGVPIVFEAGKEQGFSVGDKIVFVFDTDQIEDKEFSVNTDDYTFNLYLEQEEANNIFSRSIGSFRDIKYSIKRLNGTSFLESLENDNGESIFNLKVMGTVRYNG